MQNYKNIPDSDNFSVINGYKLAKINLESLKLMSIVGLSITDWKYVTLVEEYMNMRSMGMKAESVHIMLADEYHVSISSVKRIVKRMLKQVRL